jgi:hypothetical protein
VYQDAVPQRQQRVLAGQVAAGPGDIDFQALDELLKRVDQAGQEREHLRPRRRLLHEGETHQVQRQVVPHAVRPDGLPDPGQVLGQAGLGGMPDLAVTPPGRHTGLRPEQSALLQPAQRRI